MQEQHLVVGHSSQSFKTVGSKSIRPSWSMQEQLTKARQSRENHQSHVLWALQVCEGAAEAKPQEELPQITQSREELAAMPVRALKTILQERHISVAGLAEKSDLVDCILERCTNVSYYSCC